MGLTTRPRDRWIAWTIAVVAATSVYALVVWATGGYRLVVAGIRLSSHSWQRPALVASAGILILAVAFRAQLAAALRRGTVLIDSAQFARWLVAPAAVWALAAGVGFGTFANGGSDSYGYVSQARLFAHGRLTDTIPVSRDYRWPDVEYTLTPLGYTKGQSPGVIAPTYPPGLPLLFVPFAAFSEKAIYWVVPIFGALLIWMTYRFGVLIGDGSAGALAAVFVALSPTFLYQVVQPMSDVPCAVCWLAALLAASRGSIAGSAGAGALCSLAILIRPNLAPLALLVVLPAVGSGKARRVQAALSFLSALAPGLILLGWIQQVRYGSPLGSGYGAASDVFSMEFVVPNLARYPRWITESHTPFIWLSIAAPFWIARRASNPWLSWTGLGLCVGVWAAYLPYIFFQPNEWFYTRFLLPAIPIMIVFAAACALVVIRRVPPWGLLAFATLTAGVGVASLRFADRNGAFDIRNQESKYPLAGEFVRTRGPSNAFVLAAQHSGSIRYYAGRPTLRWDRLSPTRLDQALASFRAQGYEPILVIDGGEYDAFRERFEATGQQAMHQLTPLAVLGDARVFAFR
jgi:hypothetical protein